MGIHAHLASPSRPGRPGELTAVPAAAPAATPSDCSGGRIGRAAADRIVGSPGGDRIRGLAGDDRLLGEVDEGSRRFEHPDRDDVLLGCERVRLQLPIAPTLTRPRGGRASTFLVTWRSWDLEDGRSYALRTTPPGRRDCAGQAGSAHTPVVEDWPETVRFRLRPPRGGWCPGMHRVAVVLHWVEEIVGEPGVCPPEAGSTACEEPDSDFVERRRTIARLAFRVR